MKAPLRKIIDRRQNDYGVWVERLECGHEQHERQDHYGPTNAVRRRCKACGREAQR